MPRYGMYVYICRCVRVIELGKSERHSRRFLHQLKEALLIYIREAHSN